MSGPGSRWPRDWRSQRPPRDQAARGAGPPSPFDAAWGAWSWANRRDRTAWLGIFLALLGIGLLVERFLPGLGLGTLVVLALGLAGAAVWLLWRWRWAMVPALVLLGLGLGGLVEDLRLLPGEGWNALFLGSILLGLWAVGRRGEGRHGWALWPGLIFGLIGLARLSDDLARLPAIGLVWSGLLVLVGAILTIVAVRRRAEPRARSPGLAPPPGRIDPPS